MCVCWFENTFEHLVVVGIGAAGVQVRGNPYVHNDCPGSAGLGNASNVYCAWTVS